MSAKQTILITDDDVRNIYALKAVLLMKGYRVLIAGDGRESLKILEDHNDIDVVLMDMMMPEMDGYEAIATLRKQDKFRNLPIIAVTAQAMTGDREKCLQAGANDYLSKPIDDEKLIQLLNQYAKK